VQIAAEKSASLALLVSLEMTTILVHCKSRKMIPSVCEQTNGVMSVPVGKYMRTQCLPPSLTHPSSPCLPLHGYACVRLLTPPPSLPIPLTQHVAGMNGLQYLSNNRFSPFLAPAGQAVALRIHQRVACLHFPVHDVVQKGLPRQELRKNIEKIVVFVRACMLRQREKDYQTWLDRC
jgi:hypothetical protein